MPDEHICRCLGCAPDDRLTGERQGPGHFGVRFGHRGGSQYLPTLDGEAVADAFETFTGNPGWVALWSRTDIPGVPATRHVCLRCRSAGREPQPCYEIREGRVEMPGLATLV